MSQRIVKINSINKVTHDVVSITTEKPAAFEFNPGQATEKELNVKITKLTTEIREKHPEMSKMLEEMPVTIPTENNPEVNISKLKKYYESLMALVKQHTGKID